MKPRILVVEDEAPIRMGLVDVLVFHGNDVRGVGDGDAGLREALGETWDLLVLDVMLPGVDGFSICRAVREAKPGQAILLLTARGSEADILEGFAAGADDYVTKPFSVSQLVARVKALLRRAGAATAAFAVGGVRVDPETLCARAGDRVVDLSHRDVSLLAFLANAPGRVFSRDDLLREVWGYRRTEGVETRCVDMQVAKLRRKLSSLVDVDVIETVRGAGYRVLGPDR